VGDLSDDLNAVKDDFEHECRERPGSLPEITSRYILKRFEIRARAVRSAGSAQSSGEAYAQGLRELLESELEEVTKTVHTWPREHQVLPFLKALKDQLLNRKAALETEAFESTRTARDPSEQFQRTDQECGPILSCCDTGIMAAICSCWNWSAPAPRLRPKGAVTLATGLRKSRLQG